MTRSENERLFAVILEFRAAAADVAQQQTDNVGRVGKLESVGFGFGDAITDPIRVATNVKLVKTAEPGGSPSARWPIAPSLSPQGRRPSIGGCAKQQPLRVGF